MANNAQGQKFSKQTHAAALEKTAALANLCAALKFLGQDTPAAGEFATPREFWDWAIARWNPAQIPQTTSLPT